MNAVRQIHTDRLSVHDQEILFVIDLEHRDGIAHMIYDRDMIVVREDDHVLWIFAADRKGEFLLDGPVLCVDIKHGNAVLSCRRAEQMTAVRSKAKGTGCVVDRVLVVIFTERADRLDQFKFGRTSGTVVAVYLDLVAEFKQNVGIPSVRAEADDPGSAFSGASENVDQLQLVRTFVDAVNLHLIDAVVYRTEIFVILTAAASLLPLCCAFIGRKSNARKA